MKSRASSSRAGGRAAFTVPNGGTAPFEGRATEPALHGFSGAQRQYAIGFNHPCKAVEDPGLGVLIEIDQDVAAEDHIEGAEMGKIVQQIQLPVLDHGTDIGIELPEFSDPREMLDQRLNRQPALDLELAEDAGLGFFQNAVRQVSCENLDPPSRQHRA